MLQRHRTYQAKTFIPVASAAIDPYAEERGSLVDDERLDRWFDHLEAELRRYRSPFVAAEALLMELRLHNAELYQPERLYVNSALRVLRACVPHLSAETADVVSAAIHELLPCLLYTRRTPLTTSAATPAETAAGLLPMTHAEEVAQLTYAGAFRRVLALWNRCRAQLQQQERYVRIEVKVMDRLVHALDHMWVKTCFYSWRTYCRQLRMRKAQLRRRLIRATANETAPRFLRTWRQRAHAIALDTKSHRTSALQQEVDALYPLEHDAKSRHDHLAEEVKEKNRLVGESLLRLEESQERLRVLERLMAETKSSLAEHWAVWQECMRLLFGDVGTLPGKSDRAVRTDYLMNITDTASSLEHRARTKAGRQRLQHVGKLLLYEHALGVYPAAANGSEGGVTQLPPALLRRASKRASSSHASTSLPQVAEAKTTRRLSRAVASDSAHATAALMADVHRVFAATAAVSRPVLSPLLLLDVLRHNDAQLSLTIAFLTTLYSGGHCSLFVPALRLKTHGDARAAKLRLSATKEAAPAEAAAAAAAATPTTAVAAVDKVSAMVVRAQEGEEVQWGPMMVQDVSDGMHKVQRCTDANERYLLAVRQCMMGSEVEVIQGYLEDLFARWSATGLPLSRTRLEAVWEPITTPMELPVIKALYPAQGITQLGELVDYVARVAEFSGRPLLALAERLDATYTYDPLDEWRILRRSDEAAELFRTYAAPMAALLDWLRDDASPARFHGAHVTALLEGQLELSPAEAAEVMGLVNGDGGEVKERDDVECLMLMASSYADPSPFASPLEKAAAALQQCAPLFAQLSRESPANSTARK